ncbi:MAG: DUF2798 domain-containing protein [Candidatus Liptonbacteria bacterium]|nr:DUF2798 domain-containing protein [Candidatus Liptonbacteria bacterium]
MRIPAKYSNFVFVLSTAIFMSCLMSLIVTFVNIGSAPDFFTRWIKAWGVSFIIGWPVTAFAVPLARKVVDRITESSI